MTSSLIVSALISISPLGESKVGIPYGISKDLNIYIVFFVCYVANIIVFPLLIFLIDVLNSQFLKWKYYKKFAIKLAMKIKRGTKDKIQKYNFWGLVFFVMLPLPGTGVYAGTIASYIFKMDRKKAFLANSIGVFISAVIVLAGTLLATTI